MKRVAWGMACAGLLAMACGAIAQTETPPMPAPAAPEATPYDGPPAKEIIERFLDATGGRAAYEKIRNRVSTGTIDVPMQGIKGTLTMTQAAPNMMLSKLEIPGLGEQRQGFDGDTAWSMDMMQGARLVEGDEKKNLMQQATFNAELQWETLFKNVKAVAVEDVFGKPAYVVEATTDAGQTFRNYYDKESGLLVRSSTIQKTQMGDIPADSTISDYREVSGVKIPHKTEISSAMGMTIIMTLQSVQANVDLPADTFAVPEEVKKLVQDAGAQPAATPAP